jgi:hypothetical protein
MKSLERRLVEDWKFILLVFLVIAGMFNFMIYITVDHILLNYGSEVSLFIHCFVTFLALIGSIYGYEDNEVEAK